MVMYACGLLFLSEPCGVLVEPVHEGLDSLDGERWRGRGSRAEVTSTRRPVPRPAGSGILRSAVLVAVDPSPASAASSGARNSRICAVRGHLPTAVAPQSRLVVTSPPRAMQELERQLRFSAPVRCRPGQVAELVDAAGRRHSWIASAPQLALDDSVGHPPGPEQQSVGFEHDVAARAAPAGMLTTSSRAAVLIPRSAVADSSVTKRPTGKRRAARGGRARSM